MTSELTNLYNSIQLSRDNGLVIHWDGKILPDLTGSQTTERLPIVASQLGTTQLLGVPKLVDGTGFSTANAVEKILKDWNLIEKTQFFCFDTTSVNTGKKKGAAFRLEAKLKRKILFTPCRHHIFELILRDVFLLKVPEPKKKAKSRSKAKAKAKSNTKTSGPSVSIFDRFKEQWNDINRDNFKSGMEDRKVSQHINQMKADEIIEFCANELLTKQPRDDYREFLELTILFLGGKISPNRTFAPAGPIHHARWMAKAIYSLKIYLFREQFALTDHELDGIRDVCIFLAVLYVKAWYQCKSAIHAPNNDLNFIKEAIQYAKIDKNISKIVLDKFSKHLWYLSDEALGFAFFDSSVSVDMKKKMVKRLKIRAIDKKRVIVTPEQMQKGYGSKQLHDFVTANTLNFFKRIDVSTDFLSVDPAKWEDRDDYNDGLNICRSIQVVNDIAERAVQMFSTYNRLGTKDEEDMQYMMHCINDYNAKYPSVVRSKLS